MAAKLGVRRKNLTLKEDAGPPATTTLIVSPTRGVVVGGAPSEKGGSSPSVIGGSSPSVMAGRQFLGFASNEDSGSNTFLTPPQGSPGSSSRSSPDRDHDGVACITMTPPDRTPLLLSPGTRVRRKPQPRYVPTDWDDSLPYGGKVYLARKKKPDSWPCIALQVVLVSLSVLLVYYAWYHTDHMHFHTVKLYAHLGHMHAQALTAEKYMHGHGVERNHSEAMTWYRKAALQGHPHASYNLAVGHLQGLRVGLQPGEAHDLIRHAASNGIVEAAEALNKLCSKGRCDD